MTKRAYFGVVAGLLLLSWACISGYFFSRASTLFLTLEIASSAPSVAQLFYDVGGGFREADSRTANNSLSSLAQFKRLSFELPAESDIAQLRFDPLTTAGTFIVRNVSVINGEKVLLKIPPEDVVAFNQIAERTQRGNDVLFSTTPGANDTGLLLRLREPLSTRIFDRVVHDRSFQFSMVAMFILASLLFLLHNQTLDLLRWGVPHIRAIDGLFARIANRVANAEVFPLDSAAVWFCAVCCALFFIASGLNLNGSSAGVFPAVYQHGAPARIWLGLPRQTRNDEWGYVTPAILNQALRADRFETLNSEFGAHSAGLTGNIPVWHFSTLFRPQYWAFFILPADYAFAFYWQSKALILVLGVFAWLMLLTHSPFWSVTGSLWYFFSPLTQWAYSWPSALPEMIGLLLLAAVLACAVTVETRTLALIAESLGLIFCTVNFVLCSYLPHMIPVFWIGAFSFVAWCIAKRHEILGEGLASRLVAFGITATVLAAIGFAVFADLRVAISGIANTVYPGQRVSDGGTMSWLTLMSSFMAWRMNELRVPAVMVNICEGSSYLWLAPFSLLLLGRLRFSSFQRCVLIALWIAFSVLLIWLLAPVPASIGHILALDRAPGTRSLPALGLADVAITILCAQAVPHISKRKQLVLTMIALVFLLFTLRALNRDLDHFFSRPEVLFAALIAAGLIYLFLARRKWMFALLLIVPQAIVFGSVNPIGRGMSVFLDSDLRKFIRQDAGLLRGKWLMFSDSSESSGFLAATGAEVYTGTHHLPDIDHFRVFADNHLDLTILNRAGYLNAHLRRPEEPMKLAVLFANVVRWDVRPGDPILKQIGIKYAAFDRTPDDNALSFLRPLSEKPVDGFWLYELR